MNCEMSEEKRKSADVPKFYQNGFFHLWLVFILGFFAVFGLDWIQLAADIFLLADIILVCLKKIYYFKNGEWKVSTGWMVGTIIGQVLLLGISIYLM